LEGELEKGGRVDSVEVVIVGAGAAGLMAARELRARGRSVIVLEARDRIGGRAFTHDDPRLPIPIELGAEFIHGPAPLTGRLLEQAGLSALDIHSGRRAARRGRLAHVDYLTAIDRVLGFIDKKRPDESLDEFLSRRPGGRSLARERQLTRRFVEGFFGADAEGISARSVTPSNGEEASEAISRIGRVTQGYGALIQWLGRDVSTHLRLGHAVRSIAWQPGRVKVALARRGPTLSARAAIVTAPLGVLASSGLAIDPEPPSLRQALGGLAMGSAMRLNVWLHGIPWPTKAEQPVNFFPLPNGPFQAAWTEEPFRAPLVVLWCGGPAARALSRLSARQLYEVATTQLARALGKTRREIDREIQRVWWHDWQRDPWTRGAYSYVRVGGDHAAAALRRPVRGTLFFAGEATEFESGTVEAALISGQRAAELANRVLKR